MTGDSSVWVRNFQMSAWGLAFTLVSALLSPAYVSQVLDPDRGVTHGFTVFVWASVVNQVVGGIVVAMVIRKTSNVAKNFVTSVGIVINAILSYALWGSPLSLAFVFGALLVCAATVGYAYGSSSSRSRQPPVVHTAGGLRALSGGEAGPGSGPGPGLPKEGGVAGVHLV